MNSEQRKRLTDKAFSLIEVTIAMAIAAVALSTLMALLPQGMNTMRDAGDEAIMARIHQQVLNELQVADYETLDTYHQMEIYFDDQGEELGDSKDGGAGLQGSFQHIYTARISVPQAIGGQMPKSVGGAPFDGFSFDGGSKKNLNIRMVVIEVAAVSGLGKDFDWSEKYRSMIHTYQTTVVKMGRQLK